MALAVLSPVNITVGPAVCFHANVIGSFAGLKLVLPSRVTVEPPSTTLPPAFATGGTLEIDGDGGGGSEVGVAADCGLLAKLIFRLEFRDVLGRRTDYEDDEEDVVPACSNGCPT